MRSRGHWRPAQPSRDIGEDVLIGQIPLGLRKWHDSVTQALKLVESELLLNCVTDHFAATPSRSPGHQGESTAQRSVESNREDR